jgi:AcrR family transcriptional regulator
MSADQRRAGGRPRAFDENKALDSAIDVFWRLGYEGASVTTLTKAMGINKPSLYALFGSKEELFARALERYGLCRRDGLDAALARPTTYEVIESYLRATVDAATHGNVLGCLSIQGGLSCGPNNERIPKLLAAYREGLEETVAKALAETEDASRPPNTADARALAAYAVAIGQGLAVHAAAGVPRSKLDTIVDVALAGLMRPPATQPVPGSANSK